MSNGKIFLFIFFVFANFVLAQRRTMSADEIDALLTKGNIYFKKADFANSLRILRVAVNESKFANNDSLSAYTNNRIGRNFQELSEYSRAIEYFKNGLFHAEKAKRPDIIFSIHINLGIVNSISETKNFDLGIKHFDEALKYANKSKNSDDISLVKFNLTWAYFFNNMYKNGIEHLLYINKNIPKYWDNDFLISLNMLNGMYQSYLGNNNLANKYFLAGVNAGGDFSFKADKQFLFSEYSKFLSKNGDFKNAYNYLIKTNKINDSLFSKNKLSRTIVQTFNLEAQNYKNTLKQLQKENDLQERSFFKSKIINLLAVLISLIAAMWLFFGQKNAKDIKKINEKLTLKNYQLKIAAEKAQNASQVKSQFVSTISHELRTPLYGVIGMTDILYENNKSETDKSNLDALKFSANYLLSLINDILQISKIEESKITLDNVTFDIRKLIDAIKNALQFIATKNNNEIHVEIDSKVPHLMSGDETRLSQILMNLIGNALKFTNGGDVNIKLTLENIVGSNNFINFEIKDTGIGIADENQDKIFDKFMQITRQENDYQGTGLGLSIVKKLIDLFKSEIYLESKVGVGSAFNFTIGFENATEVEKIETHSSPINLNIKILVVDDNKINQLVTKKIIQNYGQQCKIVSSGFEAIDTLKNEIFDIILMDINMPEMNGFETSIKIRAMGIDNPIIALTAYNRKQVMQEATLSGINAILVKPFEQSKLFEIISTELNKKNAD